MAFVQSKLDAGEQLVGAKLGLTSRAKQDVMGVAEPLYGWVTSGMIAGYGEPVDVERLIHPRAEPEIAFLLGRDVTAPATVTSMLAATVAWPGRHGRIRWPGLGGGLLSLST